MTIMELPDLLQEVKSISEQVGARTVYAEPVTSGDTTVIPVATVAYGLGGGFGKREDSEQGGGGGAGFVGKPAGYIEITPAGTRFIAVTPNIKLAGAVFLGMFIGYVAGRLRKRRRTQEN